MKKIIAAALAAASVATAADAAPARSQTVYFKGDAQLAGTGCVPGSALVKGKGSSTIAVRFDRYDAAKPRSKARSNMERTSCNFNLPVYVPPGFQLSGMTMTWKGYAKGAVELRREYFIAGRRGPVEVSRPAGQFTKTDNPPPQHLSPCGAGEVRLRVNSSVRAIAPGSYITLGNAERSGKVVFQLKWQKCRPGR